MEIKEIAKISKDILGEEPEKIEIISQGGSSRHYYRILAGGESSGVFIFTTGDDRRENKAFCQLAETFNEEEGNDLKIPAVIYNSEDYSYYIQSVVGRKSLFEMIAGIRKTGGNPETELEGIVRKSLEGLVRIQTLDGKLWEDKVFNPPFGKRMVMWDLNYFKYDFLKVMGIPFNEDKLEDDFETLAKELVEVPDSLMGFMYRDFQSRNIMIDGDTPGFIDFQGGRYGPLIYDAVSFLWQAKAKYSDSFRKAMMKYYMSLLSERRNFDKFEAWNYVSLTVLFRTLQVLGAYGLRGLIERKAHFLESIPAAMENLNESLKSGIIDRYEELKRVCEALVNDPRWTHGRKSGLTLEVYSFSYKKGYPENLTGNGGGFMFDCRGMHNPGRYEDYKKLTGKDQPVIDFLEREGEAEEFVKKAIGIVTPSINAYLRRGFNDLQIGFGCTGGQHRSVYCAEHFAREISREFPELSINLRHREIDPDS